MHLEGYSQRKQKHTCMFYQAANSRAITFNNDLTIRAQKPITRNVHAVPLPIQYMPAHWKSLLCAFAVRLCSGTLASGCCRPRLQKYGLYGDAVVTLIQPLLTQLLSATGKQIDQEVCKSLSIIAWGRPGKFMSQYLSCRVA